MPTVVAPCPDWSAAPGCYPGARFVVDRRTMRASHDDFVTFASRLSCLRWMMRHRDELNRALPGVRVDVVRLDRWLLGLE